MMLSRFGAEAGAPCANMSSKNSSCSTTDRNLIGDPTCRHARLYAITISSSSSEGKGARKIATFSRTSGLGGAVCGESDGKSIASDVYDGVTYTSGAYDQGPVGTFRGTTTIPGTFPPNRFGLYDMHGNVWEYCLDTASPTYVDAPVDGSANISAGENDRILRGGSWSHNPAICRSAYRDSISPDNPGWQGRIGLRVVCVD
jgi:Sulfatase-modifying factor enzyme 1